jgi:hypothetical protein
MADVDRLGFVACVADALRAVAKEAALTYLRGRTSHQVTTPFFQTSMHPTPKEKGVEEERRVMIVLLWCGVHHIWKAPTRIPLS